MVSTDVHGDVRHPRCVSEALHHNLNGFQVAIELVRMRGRTCATTYITPRQFSSADSETSGIRVTVLTVFTEENKKKIM